VLADFRTNPEYIRLLPAKAGEVVTKEIMVISNYDEDFEVESTSSKNGHVKVLRQEKEGKAYKFTVQIAPPVVDKHLYFSDTFYVNIKDRDKLAINCVGYYLKQDVVSKKAKGDAAEFKAEPAVLDVYGTQPGKPVIREVWVSARNNKDFEIGTTSSRKGIVRLLGRQKRGPRYKLRLQITPPATEQTLKNFSDVFYVNIVGGDKREPTKLSITCRGSYSQRPKKG